MKMFTKERGAVSIFLVIILVPMITVTSLFVDASRLWLARSVVESSGDLALNTTLTQYDQDLNDIYGMMASCQDMDSFLAGIEDYFYASLVSQGVDTTDASKYANQIKNLFNGDSDIADLLQISWEDNGCTVSPMADGSLTNPALVKTQIVEFMKYRSPINAAADILESLTGAGKQVENMPDETEMTDDKNEFYKTEKSLLKTLYKAYEQIIEYNELKISKIYIENMIQNMKNYEEQYRKIHEKMVYDLYNTGGRGVFNKIPITVQPALSNPYTEEKRATAGNIKNYSDNTAKSIRDYISAENSLKNAVNSIAYTDNLYNVQYWVHMEDTLKQNSVYSNYVRKANSLCKNIEQLKNAVQYCEEGAMAAEYTLPDYPNVNVKGKNSLQYIYDGLTGQFDGIKQSEIENGKGTYHTISNRLVGISRNAVNGASSTNIDGTISTQSANFFINELYKEIKKYYADMEAGYKQVDDLVSSLQYAKILVKEYRSDFKDWKESANVSNLDDSDLAATDREEIKKEEEEKKLLESVNEEQIDALIGRLKDIKNLLGSLKEGIDDYKYNGTSIRKIDSYTTARATSGISEQKIPMWKTELASYAKSSFKFSTPAKDTKHNVTDNNNPDLEVNKAKLYKWMQEKFKDVIKDEQSKQKKKDAEDKYEQFEDEADSQAEGEDQGQLGNNGKEIKDAGGLPSSGAAKISVDKSSSINKVSKFITDLFGDFAGTLSNVGKNMRDALYVTDYITSMFSYDTFEKEMAYDKSCSDKPDKVNNLSLTNKAIGDASCYSYGNEVEYILYGNSNKANKAAAYGTVYMIRFGFDLPPVFSKYWDDMIVVDPIAAAISAATCGIIPASLVKLAICLAMTASEAAVDLKYIKEGKGIKLLKKEEEIFCQIGDGGNISTGSDEGNTAIGNEFPCFQYSDYLSLFLMLNLMDGKKADKIYLRTADVIQCNMGKVTNQSEFLLSKSQVYYQLVADVEVSPLLLKMPINMNEYGDMYDVSAWNTIHYSAVRGY